ncbi:hypothetical protein JTB14_009013 [Gonioctena quinquepunctata]|nr:hypothetical protein JTB14_009013 [Gonioctena quinquepunctata]
MAKNAIWKNEINRLTSAELSYEMTSRGMSVGTIEAMRKSFRNFLQNKEQFTQSANPITFKDDSKQINSNNKQLLDMLKDFDGDTKSSNFARISALLTHNVRRIQHSEPSSSEENSNKNQMLLDLYNIRSDFEKAIKKFNKTDSSGSASALLLNVGNSGVVTTQSSSGDESDDSDNVFSSTAAAVSNSFSYPKSVPTCKLNLKFSGDPNDLPLACFLEQVEELSIARNISHFELFRTARDLFVGSALSWYSANRKHATDWQSLVKLLRKQFQTEKYNEKLMEEIKKRTMHDTENIGMYLACIENLFNRLSIRVPDSQQLEIILPRIRPYLQVGLGFVKPNGKMELLKLCRELESRETNINEFKPPPSRKSNSLLEPDLAYVGTTREYSANCSIICFRCKKQGHKRNECKESNPDIECYKCGKPGFTVRTCPSCSYSKKCQYESLNRVTDSTPNKFSIFPSNLNMTVYSKIQIYLDFILSSVIGDERPYLHVDILGTKILGLLDSGASRTILGKQGYDKIRSMNIKMLPSEVPNCNVANGQKCEIAGYISIPFRLRDKIKIIDTLVVPTIPNSLILGADFWKKFNIVPDLRHGEWVFSDEQIEAASVGEQTVLTPGPLPRSNHGYKYILFVSDYFSKFPFFFPMRAATSANIVKILEENIFMLVGVPRFIVCDNGKAFVSRDFKNLAKKFNVNLPYTAFYHPQANAVERIHRVLKTMISAYVQENHREWDINLQKFACAIRTSKHEVTSFTPYFINFGREITLSGSAKEEENNPQSGVILNQDPNILIS